MRLLTALVTLLALAGPDASASSAADGEGFDLRWRFEPGQVLRFELKQTSELQNDPVGESPDARSELAVGLAWRVEAVADDGTATIALSIDRVRARVSSGPRSVDYDSSSGRVEGPNAAALADLYSRAIRGGYRLKVDPAGVIVEAIVPHSVADSIRSSALASLADSGSLFSPTGLKALFAQALPTLPALPTPVGTPWAGGLDLPTGPLPLDLATAYTLAGVEAHEARIESSIAVTAVPTIGSSSAHPLISASGRGDFRFDLSAGALTRSTVDQEFRLAADPDGRQPERRFRLRMTLTRIDNSL